MRDREFAAGIGPRLIAALLCTFCFAAALPGQGHTFAIEINGVLCGYAEIEKSAGEGSGEACDLLAERVFVKLSALGSRFDLEIKSTYHVDPQSGLCTYQDTRIEQGDVVLASRIFFGGREARIVDPIEKEEKTIDLPAGAILDNPLRSPHLVRDFVAGAATSMTYPIISFQEAEVHPTRFTRVHRERLELAGKARETVVLDSLDEVTGLEIRHWIEVETGMTIQVKIPGGRLIYLADPSVKKRIQMADLDSAILSKANVAIADVPSISHMKVRAIMEPTGLRLGPEDLNVPGQGFEGTVTGNRIEGTFTIEHPRYAGAGAPSFPPDYSTDPSLAEFLAPEDMIDSDDPVLIEHARRVTEGSRDSWEAACRLSRWVAQNIEYAIPGGGSARKTFDIRAGECGAHSFLLASLCRGVGIPARVIWGCMYIPNQGGAFGQHAWNEIYMGEPGWIPVDATADEPDFVDSGHIRVGIYQSLATAINMKEMEILEHRLRSSGADSEAGARADLESYVGEYTRPGSSKVFTALIQDEALAVDIPGQVVLSLREPDERGRWYAKLSSRLYCTFPRDPGGAVTALTIHEVVRMLRRSSPETIAEEVPAELRPYLGSYRFAALRVDFDVLYDGGSLAIHDPTKDEVVHLRPTEQAGRWIDEHGKNTLTFERGEEGAVTALLMDAATRVERRGAGQPAEPKGARNQVKAMLKDFHRAAAEADAERLFGHIDPEATLYGTDATERWSVEQFRAFTAPYLARGQGWITLPIAQYVHLSEGEDFAWFHERLGSTRYGAMRGSGVARKRDGRWRIVHYDTAFPVPNRIFRDVAQRIAAMETTPRATAGAGELTGEAAAVAAVLTAFHRAAGEADIEGLFRHLAADAIVLGTDPMERFDVEKLRAGVTPQFASGQGWTTHPVTQNVSVAGNGQVAWFDERLASSRFGEMRGSGALVKRDGRWQIVHFNFSLPIPNDLVSEFQRLRGKAE